MLFLKKTNYRSQFNSNGFFVIENFFSREEETLLTDIITNNICNYQKKNLSLDQKKILIIKELFLKKKKIPFFYDKINGDNNLKKFFLRNFFQEKIKKILKVKKLQFFNTQFFIMLPKNNKESLGFHQDSAYFPKFDENKCNGVVFAYNLINEKKPFIEVIPKSHKNKELGHMKNIFSKRKTVALEKRGNIFLDIKKFNMAGRMEIKLKNNSAIFFSKNLIHRTSYNNWTSFRLSFITRFNFY